MANNEIKTNAEIYREQRKERLAKAAKKKKNSKGQKVLGILVKVLCIVLVAGVVLYGIGNIATKVFCLPQKVLTAAKYEDEKIDVAEYNYYYMSLFNQIYSYAYQIESTYGNGYGYYYTGYDYTLAPAEQDYVGDEIEGVTTWADYFKEMAPIKAFMQRSLYNDAMNTEGFELTEDQKTEMQDAIDEAIATAETNAAENGFSLNNYISKTCGEGLNEKSYRELIERDYIAQYYLEWYQENTSSGLTDDEVKAYYSENKASFDYADIRLFTFSYAEPEDEESDDPVYTKTEAKKLADEFAALATDEAAFVKNAAEYAVPSQKETFAEDSATLAENLLYADISGVSEDLADWVFSADRATGDVKVFEIPDYEAYYIAYLVSPAAPDMETAGANVRHILVEAATTDADGEALSDAEIEANFAAAKTEAEAILKEWKDGEATEDSFAALATQKTDDTGSSETGGLYEDITSDSNYVPEFLDWALDSHKVGDTGIIKTDYGYHIMYYVGADEMAKWESDVRETITSTKSEEYSNGIYEKIVEAVERNDTIINYFVKTDEKLITSYSTAASSSFSY